MKEGYIWAPLGGMYESMQGAHMVPPTLELLGWTSEVRGGDYMALFILRVNIFSARGLGTSNHISLAICSQCDFPLILSDLKCQFWKPSPYIKAEFPAQRFRI